MGTAKKMPTTLLKNTPSFTRAARLDIPFSVLIEILLEPGSSTKSGKVAPGTLTAGWRARPRHRTLLGQTWDGPRRHRASPVHPAQAGPQLRPYEVVGRLPVPDTKRSKSNWPCCP